MAGSIGSLGGVSYDIIANDKTKEGTASAKSNFIVTAGDIKNILNEIKGPAKEFEKDLAAIDTAANVTSLSIGLTRDEVKGLILDIYSADTSLSEATGLIQELGRAGLTSADDIREAADSIDTLGDAIGLPSDKLANSMIPALRAFNIPLTEAGEHIDGLTVLFQKHTVESDEFFKVTQRLGPELGRMGLSIEEVESIMIGLNAQGYTGRQITTEFAQAVNSLTDEELASGNAKQILLDKLRISNDQFTTNQRVVQNAAGAADQYARAATDSIPPTERLGQAGHELALAMGGAFGPLSNLVSVLADFSGAAVSLAILDKFLLGGALAAKFSAAINFAIGVISGMGSELASVGAGLGGSLAAGVAGGLALGLAGVWVLVKTGIMSGISDLGRAIESSPLGSVVMDALKIVLAPIGSLGAGIIALVQGDFARIPEVMIAPFEQAGEAITRNIERIQFAFSGIGTVVTGGVQALGGAVNSMVQSFAGMGAIGGYASAAFGNIGGAFNAMAGQVRGVFSQMFSGILGMINSTAAGFRAAGMNIITSIVNGIVAASGGIVTAIASALNQVRALFPFSPAKEGPLAETPNWGTWMSQGMEKAGPEAAKSATENLAAPVASVASPASAGGGAGGPGGSGGSGSVNIAAGAIVINGAGQNAEEIANQVIAKLGQAMAGKRQQMGYRTTT